MQSYGPFLLRSQPELVDGAGLDGNGWVARIQQVSGLGAVAVMRIVGKPPSPAFQRP